MSDRSFVKRRAAQESDFARNAKDRRAAKAHKALAAAYRILYFRGELLEDAEEFASEDLVAATACASSKHPHLTAEIWRNARKLCVIGPCLDRRSELAPAPRVIG